MLQFPVRRPDSITLMSVATSNAEAQVCSLLGNPPLPSAGPINQYRFCASINPPNCPSGLQTFLTVALGRCKKHPIYIDYDRPCNEGWFMVFDFFFGRCLNQNVTYYVSPKCHPDMQRPPKNLILAQAYPECTSFAVGSGGLRVEVVAHELPWGNHCFEFEMTYRVEPSQVWQIGCC